MTRGLAIVAGVAYAAILLVVWGPFDMFTGMPGETGFAYMSMIQGMWGGFLYPADPLRIHTNTFYQLSYVLAELFGVGGSYVPYEIVYAVLWWARGFLVFLLVRRFFPRRGEVAYVAGALVIVHASDHALQWVGQLNQFGMIFWMLLGFYTLTVAVDRRVAAPTAPSHLVERGRRLLASLQRVLGIDRVDSTGLLRAMRMLFESMGALPGVRLAGTGLRWLGRLIVRRSRFLVLLACFFEYMSLWSYESQIFLVLLLPVALLVRCRRSIKELVAPLIAWYLVPALYIVLTVEKYASAGGLTYQETVVRRSWTAPSLLNDWWFNIAASLKFWTWASGGSTLPGGEGVVLALLAALAFVAGGVATLILLSDRRRQFTTLKEGAPALLVLLAAGMVLLTFSFPVYLILEQARALWRTQFLAGIGAGLVLASLIGLAATALARSIVRAVIIVLLGAVVTYWGALGAIQKGALFRADWEHHRAAMIQLLHVVPNVEPNTIVILTNVPRTADPFYDNLWFGLAIRLAYPYLDANGAYFYDDGTPGPGDFLKLDGDRWTRTTPRPMLPLPSGVGVGVANTIVVEYEAHGAWRVLPTLPPSLCGPCSASAYNPESLIRFHLAPTAVHRYRLG